MKWRGVESVALREFLGVNSPKKTGQGVQCGEAVDGQAAGMAKPMRVEVASRDDADRAPDERMLVDVKNDGFMVRDTTDTNEKRNAQHQKYRARVESTVRQRLGGGGLRFRSACWIERDAALGFTLHGGSLETSGFRRRGKLHSALRGRCRFRLRG